MNVAALSGNISTEIELKHTQSGIPVTSFNLAVRRPGTKDDVTDFFRIVAWRSTAEFISGHFSKGDGIELQCTATTRKFTDKNGNQREVTEFVADRAYFGKAKKSGNQSQTNGQNNGVSYEQNASVEEFTEYESDDLPF